MESAQDRRKSRLEALIQTITDSMRGLIAAAASIESLPDDHPLAEKLDALVEVYRTQFNGLMRLQQEVVSEIERNEPD